MNSPIMINTKDVEGDFALRYIEPLKLDQFEFYKHVLLCFLTLGFWFLVIHWSVNFRKKCYFKNEENITLATHFFVINEDKTS